MSQKRSTSSNDFASKKNDIALRAFAEFNDKIFSNRLPANMTISWNSRLVSTAGIARMTKIENYHMARIELSSKILDSEDKMRSTLVHEMCHVANWLIDKTNCGHGERFHYWGKLAEKSVGIPVTRCHTYQTFRPHQYSCLKCGQLFSRHRGVNIERANCKCGGKLVYLGRADGDKK